MMDKVAFTIFGQDIAWYAIMIVTGMLLGMLIAGSLFKKKGMPFDIVVDFAIVVLPLAIIGARLYYMVFSPRAYTFWALFDIPDGISWWGLIVGALLSFPLGLLAAKINPLKFVRIKPAEEGDKLRPQTSRDYAIIALITVLLGLFISRVVHLLLYDTARNIYELFNIRGGGLAIYGGVIGGAAGMLIVARFKKMGFKQILSVLDCAAPALILGQAVGRWGNFFNQEAHGAQVTNPAWQFFPYATYITEISPSAPVAGYYQATFFYEFLANLIGCALIYLLVYKNFGKKGGLGTAVYFLWYGLWRGVIEGLRTDSLYSDTFRISQLLSILLFLAACACILWLFFKELSDTEKIAGIVACSVVLLSSLLWVIGGLTHEFEYSAFLDAGVKLSAIGLAGAALTFLGKSRNYLPFGLAVLTLAIAFFALDGLIIWWAALIICALLAAGSAVTGVFLKPSAPSEAV